MGWGTGVQSQVESYQRLKKMILDTALLNTQLCKVVSRVKWSNPRKGVASSPSTRYSSYWKGTFDNKGNEGVQFDMCRCSCRNRTLGTKITRNARGTKNKQNRRCSQRKCLVSCMGRTLEGNIITCIVSAAHATCRWQAGGMTTRICVGVWDII